MYAIITWNTVLQGFKSRSLITMIMNNFRGMLFWLYKATFFYCSLYQMIILTIFVTNRSDQQMYQSEFHLIHCGLGHYSKRHDMNWRLSSRFNIKEKTQVFIYTPLLIFKNFKYVLWCCKGVVLYIDVKYNYLRIPDLHWIIKAIMVQFPL